MQLGSLRNWLKTLFIWNLRCSQHLRIIFQMSEEMYLFAQRGVGGRLEPESCSLLMPCFACSVLYAISRVKGKRWQKAPRHTPSWGRSHLPACCASDAWKFLSQNIHQTQLQGAQLGCWIVLPMVIITAGFVSESNSALNIHTKAFCLGSCREFRSWASSWAGVIILFGAPHMVFVRTVFNLLKCYWFFAA